MNYYGEISRNLNNDGISLRATARVRQYRYSLGAYLLAMLMLVPLQGRSQSTPSASSQVNQASENSAPAPSDDPPKLVQRPAVMPVIGPGDLLKVSVFGAPESDQEVRVGADGSVSLNFVGSVHVAGLTTEHAQALIAKKLQDGGFFTEPQVSVFSKEYATQGVSVLGEVQKPGVYPVLGSRRLFDIISLAGGTTQKAGKVVTITHRDRPQQPFTVALSNEPNGLAANVEVFPGDTVIISKAGVVYVVGDVRRPSGVTMENDNMTVLKALAEAEGTNPTASLNKAKLIRKTSDGHQEIPLQLKDMLAARSPDVAVQAEDIIFVPSSAASSAGRRSLEAIIQMATGLAIYRR
jgi:polysaccharide export outer membrane protein